VTRTPPGQRQTTLPPTSPPLVPISKLSLTPGFADRVDLSANSGSVHVDQPVTIQGEINRRHIIGAIGQGPGTLSAHSSSGSVNVR
jgi:hypothetical protein